MTSYRFLKIALSASVAAVVAAAAAPQASATEPAAGTDLTGRTVYLAPNGRLRYGDSLLSRVYSHTAASLEIKGTGVCTTFNCPVVHNGISLFARRSRLDLDRPTGTVVTERTLRRGDDGSDVRAMQEVLVKKGFTKVTPDGNYGSETEDAVREFQRKSGLNPDGAIGAETREKLKI